MRMRKTGGDQGEIAVYTAGRRKNILANIVGMVLALGIAFGGLFLVQYRLAREAEDLLQGKGTVELPSADGMELETDKEPEAEHAWLTEDELLQAVKGLTGGAEAYPHEPSAGQLSMAEAIAVARTWMEDFLMPHLGQQEFALQDYKINCFLWAVREESESSEEGEGSPLSYWKVKMSGQDMEAELTLSAMSGQILDAAVSCSFPVREQDWESRMELLGDYADSFELGEDYTYVVSGSGTQAPEEDGRVMYQSIGSGKLYAVIRANSMIFNTAETGEYTKINNIRLYLSEGAG